MAGEIVVADTSPIIALVGIAMLPLLDLLASKLLVPVEVYEELRHRSFDPVQLASLRTFQLCVAPPGPSEADPLDAGERAAIAVAASVPGSLLLMDESAGRKIAVQLGITPRGSLGLLLEAKQRGHVPAIKPLIGAMLANGYRLAPKLIDAVLRTAGE